MRSLPLLAACIALLGCPIEEAPGPMDHEPIRFIAVGDTGEGNVAQYAVARVMADVCADQGCDFALLLGDNIYTTGVNALDDSQWDDKFERPYAELDLTFYAVLGNHDYGNLTTDPARADFQVAYSEVSDKWEMPHNFYEHRHSNVDFFALDTNSTLFPTSLEHQQTTQDAWLAERFPIQRRRPDHRWRIAYGHHPYLSNGRHGNAGAFDGFGSEITISGQPFKERFEERLCGNLDLYLCGHDHDRQWLEPTCEGTQFIVSGAGAKLRDFRGDQPMHWGDDQDEGFLWIEIDDDTLTLQFWDRYGEMNYEGGWTRER
ncbi:MAG: hypothetical protein GY898_12305 [Proteobacteria bacterium]|nr:hypothetical protein [Pseudomonadota bacterium]